MIACIISAELARFPGSVIFKYVVKTKCHYESPNGGSHHYSGQQKLVLRHYNGMLFKPCKKSQGCCKLRGVVAESSSSLFAKKSVHVYVAHFTAPVWTCFAATDVNPLYGVSQSNYKSFSHTTYLFKYAFNRNILSVSSCLFHFFRRLDFHYLLCIFSR